MSSYGKRGGEGPTRGQKASTYSFTFPDGTTGKKRSFHVHDEKATVAVYQHEGKWYAAGIVPSNDIPAWVNVRVEGVRK